MKTKIKAPEWFVDGMKEIRKHKEEQDKIIGDNPLDQEFANDTQRDFMIKEALSRFDKLGKDVLKYEMNRKLYVHAFATYLWAKFRFENDITGDADYLPETEEIEIDTTLTEKVNEVINLIKEKLS